MCPPNQDFCIRRLLVLLRVGEHSSVQRKVGYPFAKTVFLSHHQPRVAPTVIIQHVEASGVCLLPVGKDSTTTLLIIIFELLVPLQDTIQIIIVAIWMQSFYYSSDSLNLCPCAEQGHSTNGKRKCDFCLSVVYINHIINLRAGKRLRRIRAFGAKCLMGRLF